jgi:LAO/AO transport system kinase
MSATSDAQSQSNKKALERIRKKRKKKLEAAELVDRIKAGDATALSEAITLIESTHITHQHIAQDVISGCIQNAGKSVRLGITGVPGVGKSTFIESFGLHLIDKGHRVAVLAIDPTSQRSKGSILGDKTRMHGLTQHKDAFVRPSPAADALGGVARKTRESIVLCEAAGFDTIIIETVGVGQSETVVHSMVDFFLLLMLAGAGDELQGIKRGIMEMADAIAINKADGDNVKAAQKASREYKNAVHLFPPNSSGWVPKVLTCSALKKDGLPEILDTIENYTEEMKSQGLFVKKRQKQDINWMHDTIVSELKRNFYNNPDSKSKMLQLEARVKSGEITPFMAAHEALDIKDD